MIGAPLLGLDTLLTQQAMLERDQSTRDEYGGKAATDWQPLATVPCFMWWGTGAIATRIGATRQHPEATVDLNTGGMIVPQGTDVTARDRVSQVLNAAGDVVTAGPLELLAVAEFEGLTEITFRRVS